jgi:hypothetical protein
MKLWKKVFAHMALSGVVISGVAVVTFASPQQSAAQSNKSAQSSEPTASTANYQAQLGELPESPGATFSRMQDQAARPQSSNEDQTNPQPQPGAQLPAQPAPPPASNQPQSAPSPTPPQKPVGTAAAETPVVSGMAASQPAGAAIAPAKQRRARTIVLRVGALVGAGVAVGTVVALTAATPSKPPGAH